MNIQDYLEQKEADSLYFWYQARLKLIDQLLAAKLDGWATERQLLDVGCGTGTELEVLKKYGQVTALDTDEQALAIIGEQDCQTIQGDIEQVDIGEARYDCVCCFDILEHLEQDTAVLQKIFRALKPGGYLFFTVPAFPALFSSHDQFTGHVRRYRRDELSGKINASGFASAELHFWNFFLFLPIALVRLFKKLFLLGLLKRTASATDAQPLPKFLNSMLYHILNLENILIAKGLRAPVGLSLFGWAKKL